MADTWVPPVEIPETQKEINTWAPSKEEEKPKSSINLDDIKKVAKRFLFGPTSEETGADKAGIKETQGPGLMEIPGVSRATDWLANKVDPDKGQGDVIRGNLGTGVRFLGHTLASGFDPRTAGIKPAPKDIELLPPERKPLAFLPEKTLTSQQQPKFIAPPSGIKGEVAPANVSPDVAAKVGGLVDQEVPTSGARGNAFDPSELAERNRINNLNYDQAGQNPGSSISINSKPLSMPPESGDTRGGFNSQTNSDKSLSYPLDVVPNRLRPRAAQRDVLSTSGIKGKDLSTPQPMDSDIGFVSDKGEDVAQSKPERYNASGATTGEGDLPSAKPTWRKPQAGNFGEESKAPLDIEKTINPDVSSSEVKFKDINSGSAWFRSADKVLASRPESAPIAQALTTANDSKLNWIATTERSLASMTKGLGKSDRVIVGRLLDNPSLVENAPQDLVQRAMKIRAVLTDIHESLPEGIGEGGKDVGFIENYLTHIDKQPDDIKSAIKSIWDYHLGEPSKAMFGMETEGSGSFGKSTVGNKPTSDFIKERTARLRDIELDVNKVLPAYVESIAKVKFDRPAVEASRVILDKIPDSKLKELAGAYLRNYTRYDAMPGLSEAWNQFSGRLARITSRSMLGFNTGLQTLHLARIPANLYPELGGEYLAKGAAQLAKQPIKSWQEAASLGLLQNEIRPMAFKTPMEKADSVLQFGQMADYLDKAIGYYGFKAKYIAEGLPEAEASAKALGATKQASLTIDPSRSMMGFASEGGTPANAFWRLTTQFKQVPAKIVEQYISIAANAKRNPAAAARMVAGVTMAAGLWKAGGVRTFHLNPGQFVPTDLTASPVGKEMINIYKALGKGDVIEALKETALWLTPAGKSLQRQMENGPSFMEPSPKEKEPSSGTSFRMPRVR